MPTWLHCEVICCTCWSMQAILCPISLNWLVFPSFHQKQTISPASQPRKPLVMQFCRPLIDLIVFEGSWENSCYFGHLGLDQILPHKYGFCAPYPSLWQTHHPVPMQYYTCVIWLQLIWRFSQQLFHFILVFGFEQNKIIRN